MLTLAAAKIQWLLAIMDMGAINCGGVVYRFITMGYHWQMIRYDRKHFMPANIFDLVFHTMRHEEEKWLQDYSIGIEAIHAALVTGG